jgi:hypothetical protein
MKILTIQNLKTNRPYFYVEHEITLPDNSGRFRVFSTHRGDIYLMSDGPVYYPEVENTIVCGLVRVPNRESDVFCSSYKFGAPAMEVLRLWLMGIYNSHVPTAFGEMAGILTEHATTILKQVDCQARLQTTQIEMQTAQAKEQLLFSQFSHLVNGLPV